MTQKDKSERFRSSDRAQSSVKNRGVDLSGGGAGRFPKRRGRPPKNQYSEDGQRVNHEDFDGEGNMSAERLKYDAGVHAGAPRRGEDSSSLFGFDPYDHAPAELDFDF